MFTHETLKFLRALKRNNDREWFKERKVDFDAHVQRPLLALLDQLAVDMHDFAPDLACSPKESTFRQYRDTRFSEDRELGALAETCTAWAPAATASSA